MWQIETEPQHNIGISLLLSTNVWVFVSPPIECWENSPTANSSNNNNKIYYLQIFVRFGEISGRIWSSQNTHGKTKQALIFSELSKNLHGYMLSSLTKNCIFENKNLSTWQTLFIYTSFPRSGDRTPSKDTFWREFVMNACVIS